MTRIPVVLVTGFLGSGKTTLLRRLAEAHPERRLLFLVNELAETDVDGQTLAATGLPTQSVVGGSLFCECKAGDFVRTLRETVLAEHSAAPVELLVIETSGMADPGAIGTLLRDHGLERFFSLRRIVTVVAPAKLPRLLGNLPVVEAQLRVSDLIILNKMDTVDAAVGDAVESAIRVLNPRAEIVRARYCHFPFVLPEGEPEAPHGPLSTCDANPFSTVRVVWPAGHSVDSARAWLERLSPAILRVKGSLRTPEGVWFVERTLDGLELRLASTAPVDPALVLIAHDDDESALAEAVAALDSLSPAPNS